MGKGGLGVVGVRGGRGPVGEGGGRGGRGWSGEGGGGVCGGREGDQGTRKRTAAKMTQSMAVIPEFDY